VGFLCFLIVLNKARYLVEYVPHQFNSSYPFPTFNFQEASVFFKKRAIIEDEYGKQLQKLARTSSEVYALSDGKAGYAAFLTLVGMLHLTLSQRSFVSSWQSSMRVHEMMADNRIRFSQRLNEMGDELSTLVKEVEKNRKQVRYSFNAIRYS
jgi:hypothetical protein